MTWYVFFPVVKVKELRYFYCLFPFLLGELYCKIFHTFSVFNILINYVNHFNYVILMGLVYFAEMVIYRHFCGSIFIIKPSNPLQGQNRKEKITQTIFIRNLQIMKPCWKVGTKKAISSPETFLAWQTVLKVKKTGKIYQ